MKLKERCRLEFELAVESGVWAEGADFLKVRSCSWAAMKLQSFLDSSSHACTHAHRRAAKINELAEPQWRGIAKHTHSNTHAHTHMHKHTHTRARAHKRALVDTNPFTPSSTHTNLHTYTNTNTKTHKHKWTLNQIETRTIELRSLPFCQRNFWRKMDLTFVNSFCFCWISSIRHTSCPTTPGTVRSRTDKRRQECVTKNATASLFKVLIKSLKLLGNKKFISKQKNECKDAWLL